MAVRRLASGRYGSSMRYVFHPLVDVNFYFLSVSLHWVLLFFFFSSVFHPSSPSIDAISGVGVGN